MRFLARLERRLGWLAVPNLTLALIASQIVVYFVTESLNHRRNLAFEPPAQEVMYLIPAKVLDGEVWRLVTFLLLPPVAGVFWALLFWYAFYLFGTAMEGYWGTFRYNFYLFVGYVAITAAAFLTPDVPVGNAFLDVTVFLAVAWVAPEMMIYLFFILPVPIKWLARVTWFGVLLVFVAGDWSQRAQAVASVANFLLFFWPEIWDHVRTGRRHMTVQASKIAAEGRQPEYHHKCRVCGITDRTHRQMEFRYCSRCAGRCCYCIDHLKAHEHVVEPAPPTPPA